jgi:hypothetical protein
MKRMKGERNGAKRNKKMKGTRGSVKKQKR